MARIAFFFADVVCFIEYQDCHVFERNLLVQKKISKKSSGETHDFMGREFMLPVFRIPHVTHILTTSLHARQCGFVLFVKCAALLKHQCHPVHQEDREGFLFIRTGRNCLGHDAVHNFNGDERFAGACGQINDTVLVVVSSFVAKLPLISAQGFWSSCCSPRCSSVLLSRATFLSNLYVQRPSLKELLSSFFKSGTC